MNSIRLVLFGLLAMFIATSVAMAAEKPNILVIWGDDIGGFNVSAYNMGPGAMERAIASNGGTRDLWHLLETPPASNRIRLETKQYYPKFIASSIIAKDPERYGFTRPKQNALEIEQVAVH